MILQQLQTYLRTHPQTSLEELARQFQTDADALREMLHVLIRKGRVRKLAGKQCGGCHSCAPESLELYEWVNSDSGRSI
ncbi:FeoC-like transcriptional regulator [Phormidium nigroviride]